MMFSVHRFASLASTNLLARDYPPNAVLVAEEQTRGKGRFRRQWSSGKGGLWVSVVLRGERDVQDYTMLASLAALSVAPEAELKWPNDLLHKGKKLCGILSEAVWSGNQAEKVIVGIGMNVNNPLPPALADRAVSLSTIRGEEVGLGELLDSLLRELEKRLRMEKKAMLREYRENCSTLGKEVKVKTILGSFEGRAVDIDEEGRLVVETPEGRKVLEEGDVSLTPLSRAS